MKIIQWKKNLSRYAPAFILAAMIIVLVIANRNFLSGQSIFNLMLQVSAVGVVAFGAMLVLISSGIDFSSGYCMALAGVVAGYLYNTAGNSGVVLIITAIIVGALVGLVNGLIITKLNLHPFISTLAMMSVCKGLSVMVGEGGQTLISTGYLLALGQDRLFGIVPYSFILFIVVAVIMWFIVNRTRVGVYTYAMGGNEDAVFYSGINQNLFKVLVYVIAGACYGIAAILTVSQVTVISSNISGDVLLDGIASAVIGGTSLQGGRGTVSGTIIGAFIITLITTLLTFLGIPPLLRDAIKGCIIIAALLFDVAISRISKKVIA